MTHPRQGRWVIARSPAGAAAKLYAHQNQGLADSLILACIHYAYNRLTPRRKVHLVKLVVATQLAKKRTALLTIEFTRIITGYRSSVVGGKGGGA
jgi:hypothetical protein